MESEAALNDCLNWFLGVGTAGEEVFEALEESNFFGSLLSLLTHANSDISNVVVTVFHEIFHDEEGFEDVDLMSKLAVCALKSDLFLLLVQHCKRLDRADPDDNQATFQALQLIEDLFELLHAERDNENLGVFYESLRASALLSLLIEMFTQDPKAVKTQCFAAQITPGDAANRFYAAELTATIFQLSASDLSHEAVQKLWITVIDGLGIVEPVLVSLSIYRQRDPVDDDEQEFMLNLFDLLGALLLNSREARLSFADERCEGFELVKHFMRELNMARIRAIQILDYALAANDSSDLCISFLNGGGLKCISPVFMGKGVANLQKKYPKLLHSVDLDEAHACAIVSSLFKNTPMQSAAYFRLLAKFVEAGGEKFERLKALQTKYQSRVDEFDAVRQVEDEDQDEWLLDRMNAGSFVLQQIDLVLLILANHERVISLIESEEAVKEQIEVNLFEAVRREATNLLVLDEPELVKRVVSQWLEHLQEPQTLLLYPFLHSICQ